MAALEYLPRNHSEHPRAADRSIGNVPPWTIRHLECIAGSNRRQSARVPDHRDRGHCATQRPHSAHAAFYPLTILLAGLRRPTRLGPLLQSRRKHQGFATRNPMTWFSSFTGDPPWRYVEIRGVTS